MISYSERVFWSNQVDESLGKWRVIPKKLLQTLFISFLLVTPFTLWALPGAKYIKEVKY